MHSLWNLKDRGHVIDGSSEHIKEELTWASLAENGDPGSIAKIIEQCITHAVRNLTAQQVEQLSNAMDLAPSEQAAKQAMLILCGAAMFHERLDEAGIQNEPLPVMGGSPATDGETEGGSSLS